jgi:hypothetical protein
MNITWHGDSFFQINVQKEKQENINIVIDPDSKWRSSKNKAEIILLTKEEDGFLNNNDSFVISSPGEYEIKDVYVKGISEKNKKTFYFIEAEGLSLCHLGEFTDKELSPEQQESIGNVDILMIPAGGGALIEPKVAAQIVSQIEPKIVIPMNHGTGKDSLKNKTKQEGVEEFLKVMGIKNKEELPKLSIKAKDLLTEEKTKIIILESK